MDWLYLTLMNGRLLDDDGFEANSLWPSFESETEAEAWLEAEDICASVR